MKISYTVAQAAAEISCTEKQLREAIRSQRVRWFRFHPSGEIRISREALLAYVACLESLYADASVEPSEPLSTVATGAKPVSTRTPRSASVRRRTTAKRGEIYYEAEG